MKKSSSERIEKRITSSVYVGDGTLRNRIDVSSRYFILEVEIKNPRASCPLPGQFFTIECGGGKEHLLRRPFAVHSIVEWSKEYAVIQFLVEEVGWGTRRLRNIMPGDKIGILGPLGRGFKFFQGNHLLVSGGIGVAPLHFAACYLEERKIDYTFVAGFKSSRSCYSGLEKLEGNVLVFTDDGSAGKKGFASSGAVSAFEQAEYVAVLACGPEPMMREVFQMSSSAGIACQVSLAERMACGVGACRGCVRRGKNRNLCVCKEGPVFDGTDVW
ncbi:MAG: dihydroorotate dehydrogenase electron transfer subunit [Actinomycetota bacterium]|nr:dihydroorotate dehydrogenase electron transfer subunit [Actinomycetota bacterium]